MNTDNRSATNNLFRTILALAYLGSLGVLLWAGLTLATAPSCGLQ